MTPGSIVELQTQCRDSLTKIQDCLYHVGTPQGPLRGRWLALQQDLPTFRQDLTAVPHRVVVAVHTEI